MKPSLKIYSPGGTPVFMSTWDQGFDPMTWGMLFPIRNPNAVTIWNERDVL